MPGVLQVVVLIGTGWSYMTPFLRDREKRILMIVIPLQARPVPITHLPAMLWSTHASWYSQHTPHTSGHAPTV